METYAAHAETFFDSPNQYNLSQYQTEYNAFEVNSYLFQGMGVDGSKYGNPVWANGWAKVDKKFPPLETSRKAEIDAYISTAYSGLSSAAAGSDFRGFGYNVKRVP